MHVLVLGSGAGGGVPQWNCGCPQCDAARAGDPNLRTRTQSSIAVSADGRRWVLLNASPDVRAQLAANPALHPKSLRHSPIEAVALTNADIDHCLGLMILREGGAPAIYASSRTARALRDGLRILPALASYGPVHLREVAPETVVEFADRAGVSLGLRATPFAVASKPPPYMLPLLSAEEAADDYAGDTVAWVVSSGDGPRAVYVPGVKTLDARLREAIADAALVLIDGTMFTDDEMIAMGASEKTARVMGHAPLTGDGGLVSFLDGVEGPRKVLVHINNSNPALHDEGEARAHLAAHDIDLAYDGMELCW